jgi:glutaredoxin
MQSQTFTPTRSAQRSLQGLICALGLMSGLHTTTQAQEVYRIVEPSGRVTFSDRPPVSSSTQSNTLGKLKATGGDEQALLPLALRQAAAKFPVTLYTNNRCAPCDTGRSLLQGRGIPFVEKTVNTQQDVTALQNLAGQTSLPFLTVGAQHIAGFLAAEWTQYLNAAGYPEHSALPASYHRAPAMPLVAEEKATAPVAPAPAPNTAAAPSPARPAVNPNNPAGIQF